VVESHHAEERDMIEGPGWSDPTAAARATMLDATLHVVRRRRHARRVAAAAIVIAAYAAGLATHAIVGESDGVVTAPAAELRAAPEPLAPSPVTPGALESRAEATASQDERVVLLRAAGDRYLSDFSDVAAALRCYRELLKLVSSDERSRFDPADTWLLAALKRGSD
jgi:hypothetical protein